ncbi:unnamed protein product, partial [Polarella glacialis]
LLSLAQEILASEELQSSIAPRSLPPLTLEDIWVWKLLKQVDGDPPVSYGRPVPDLLVALWLGESKTPRPKGLALRSQSGAEVQELVIPFERNRLVMWTQAQEGRWLLKDLKKSQFEPRRADLVLSFRRSSGRRDFPGITDFTAARWPQPYP